MVYLRIARNIYYLWLQCVVIAAKSGTYRRCACLSTVLCSMSGSSGVSRHAPLSSVLEQRPSKACPYGWMRRYFFENCEFLFASHEILRIVRMHWIPRYYFSGRLLIYFQAQDSPLFHNHSGCCCSIFASLHQLFVNRLFLMDGWYLLS